MGQHLCGQCARADADHARRAAGDGQGGARQRHQHRQLLVVAGFGVQPGWRRRRLLLLEGGVAKSDPRGAQDVAAKGVRVNTIAPGAVDTPMHADHRAKLFEYEKYIPLGRMQLAEDLAGTAIFLASDASGYITGQTLHVNGGLIMND